MDRDAKSLYDKFGVAFEQRWFPVFNCLLDGTPMSVTDIADRLRVSHVSVSVIRTGLEQAGLIASRPDEHDGRRRVLALTEKGEALAQEMERLFDALNKAATELNAEAGDAIATIARLEKALDEKPLSTRVMDLLDRPERHGEK